MQPMPFSPDWHNFVLRLVVGLFAGTAMRETGRQLQDAPA